MDKQVPSARPSHPRVGFFVTCLVNLLRPNIGFAAVQLLEEAGCTVEIPDAQTCCGQPNYNSGDFKNTKKIARQFIELFEGYDYVVMPSGSCAATIKLEYPKFFADDSAWLKRAQKLADKSYELTQFLSEVLNAELPLRPHPCKATYHDSCSGLRELGIQQQPRNLLKKAADVEIIEMQDSDVCCGFGGTFCVKYPEISAKLVDDKIKNIESSNADTLIGGDLGCLLNIQGRLSRLNKDIKVYHVAEILAGTPQNN